MATYDYTVNLNDLFSNKFSKIAKNTTKVYNNLSKPINKFKNNADRSAHSIDSLQNRIEKLSMKRNASQSVKEIRKINGEVRKLEKQLTTLKNLPPKKFSSNLASLKDKIKGVGGTLIGAFSIYKIAEFGKKTLDVAGNMDQVRKKFDTVFGASSKIVEEAGKAQSKSMGMTINEYKKATAAVGDLLIPMGFQRDTAAGMSTDLIGLSGALAEWSGGKYKSAEVSEILSKAMLGEREQLKSLGISISENDVKGRLLANGQDKLTGKAYERAKAMATMQLIMEKSTDAQESFANGAGSLTRLQNELSATFRQVYQNLAVKLIPVFKNWLEKTMSLVDWLGRNKEMVVGVGGAILGFVTVAWGVIKVIKIWRNAQAALNLVMSMNPIGLIIIGIAALVAAVIYAWNKFEWFKGGILGVWEVMKGFGQMIKDYVINRFWELINGLTGIGKTLMHFFKGEWSQAWETGKQAASDLVGVGSKKKALEQGLELGNKFKEGYNKGASQIAIDKVSDSQSFADKLLATNNSTNGNSQDSNNPLNDEIKEGMTNITSGGSRPTNITINLGKFQDQLIIQAQNVKEGAEEMRDIILEELTRVLVSGNRVALQ